MTRDETSPRECNETRRRIAWVPAIVAVFAVAWLSLARLRDERLFLFAQPVDRPARYGEFSDAAKTAETWTKPTMAFLGVVAIVALAVAKDGPLRTIGWLKDRAAAVVQRNSALCAAFAIASLLDLASTWNYCQRYSLEDELHPAIKLVGYAYGLTVGIAAAKLLQAGLVVSMAALFPRAARTLLLVTTAGYLAAAFWNHRLL
ncbi:MAG: hypothetical protein ACT4QC_22060 [Planctomycetaceae bacterium]